MTFSVNYSRIIKFLFTVYSPYTEKYLKIYRQLTIVSKGIKAAGVPNRGPSGPPGGHGTLKGGHGYKIEFWGAMEDFRGATTQQVNF